MKWRNHSKDVPNGAHAFLSGSKYAWVNDSEEKLVERYNSYLAAQKGTKLHEFACDCIRIGQMLPDMNVTLTMYVNDCLSYNMRAEQILYYSKYAFGTADAISFENNILRIFDLKTGKLPASLKQLEIYAAYFCLEYDVSPSELDLIDLRIYQNDSINQEIVGAPQIVPIMDKIVTFDQIIFNLMGDRDDYYLR